MKRTCSALLLFFLLSLFASAQKDTAFKPENDSIFTGYIIVAAGVGIPVGVFGYDQPNVNTQKPSINGNSDFASAGGFARTGSNFTITGIASLKRPGSSFMGQLGYSRNPFDVTTYASNNISKEYNYYQTTNVLNSTSKSYYQVISLVGGMYLPIVGKEVIVGLRMMGGAFLCITPDVQYSGQATMTLINNTSPVSDHIQSGLAFSWEVSAGLDARYRINNRLSAVAAVSYFFCLPKFTVSETNSSGGTANVRYVCPVSLFNITAGLGYRI